MDRPSQKIRHLLQTYKDSLTILKEVQNGEGSSFDFLLQVSHTHERALGKLIADVEFAIDSQRKALADGKRKLLSDHVVTADMEPKQQGLLKSGICYQHGEHSELMDPLLWGNLPVPLLEVVFDRVMLKIHDSTQIRSIKLTDPQQPNKIRRLMYTTSGDDLLALGSNAAHKVWKWMPYARPHPCGKATASVRPMLWHPRDGVLLTNDTIGINPEEAMHCMALSKNDCYLISASGGRMSLFNVMTFKVMTTCLAPSPAVTFLAFFPRDNNIIAVGMEDSTIRIYNLRVDKFMTNLRGHTERITGLAFTSAYNVLVSAGADGQLCLWYTETWKKLCTQSVRVDSAQVQGDVQIEFHSDEVRFLAVHKSQLAIYDAGTLGCLQQWVNQSQNWAPLSNASFSCDGELIFAGFVDASVAIFDTKSLLPRCQLASSAYNIPQDVSGIIIYPIVIAAHTKRPNQFALGLSDGSVHVIEPSESEDEWGTLTILPHLHYPSTKVRKKNRL